MESSLDLQAFQKTHLKTFKMSISDILKKTDKDELELDRTRFRYS